MKVIFLIVACSAFALATDLQDILTPEGKFTSKYDSIDVDNVFRNNRLFKTYVDCLKGLRCTTKPGQFLKVALEDAVENECARCSNKQREIVEKILKMLIKQKPKVWAELEKIYDKEGKLKQKFGNRLQM